MQTMTKKNPSDGKLTPSMWSSERLQEALSSDPETAQKLFYDLKGLSAVLWAACEISGTKKNYTSAAAAKLMKEGVGNALFEMGLFPFLSGEVPDSVRRSLDAWKESPSYLRVVSDPVLKAALTTEHADGVAENLSDWTFLMEGVLLEFIDGLRCRADGKTWESCVTVSSDLSDYLVEAIGLEEELLAAGQEPWKVKGLPRMSETVEGQAARRESEEAEDEDDAEGVRQFVNADNCCPAVLTLRKRLATLLQTP